jgi:hypothetical protein
VQYALELYLPSTTRDRIPETVTRARTAAEDMQFLGTPVRFLWSIFLPEDEVCFLIFEASSEERVAELARRASIAFERLVAIEVALDDA